MPTNTSGSFLTEGLIKNLNCGQSRPGFRAWFDFCTLLSGRKVSFVSYGQSMTGCEPLKVTVLASPFSRRHTTQPGALLNNGKNVIWLLCAARRYHSLGQQCPQNRDPEGEEAIKRPILSAAPSPEGRAHKPSTPTRRGLPTTYD